MYGRVRTVVWLGQPVTAVPMPIKSARVLEKRAINVLSDGQGQFLDSHSSCRESTSACFLGIRKGFRHAH